MHNYSNVHIYNWMQNKIYESVSLHNGQNIFVETTPLPL